jgi:hypothetical protein
MERLNAFMCNPGNYGDKEVAEQLPCFPSKYLHWTPNQMQDIAIWVDCWDSPCIQEITRTDIKYKIAVLVEPRVLAPWHYEFVLNNRHHFDLIFSTYDDFGKETNDNHKFKKFPGGARTLIHPTQWSIYPKTKNIVTIVSGKRYMPGHILRHTIREKLNTLDASFIDYVNPPFDNKSMGLKDYRFELVIENEDDKFFSEKILDSMLSGCIPIYWTSDDTSYLDMFDKSGIVTFKNQDELMDMLSSNTLNEDFYLSRIKSVTNNFEEAKKYISLGDMLWKFGIEELIETKLF